ncbi:hypothetical protein LX36DRAFT_296955 [Colletotrichum falcatum]|nr:hypothetical protein LX36DRAFT_296955 [Colletotrichum falcatum]
MGRMCAQSLGSRGGRARRASDAKGRPSEPTHAGHVKTRVHASEADSGRTDFSAFAGVCAGMVVLNQPSIALVYKIGDGSVGKLLPKLKYRLHMGTYTYGFHGNPSPKTYPCLPYYGARKSVPGPDRQTCSTMDPCHVAQSYFTSLSLCLVRACPTRRR